MKANPLNILLNKNFKVDKKIYVVSGNEFSLMEKIKSCIILQAKSELNFELKNIKNVNEAYEEVGLFDNGNIYLLNNIKGIDRDIIQELKSKNSFFIFFAENSNCPKSIKKIFETDNDCLLIDCYELNRNEKSLITKSKLDFFNIKIVEDLYWSLIDSLDNKYMLLENELEKFKELKQTHISKEMLGSIILKYNYNVENIFMMILNKNKQIINTYNNRIKNNNDVNELFYVFKQFSYLIINNENQRSFNQSLPRYLFREKRFLNDLFNRFNSYKKNLLITLLYETEKAIRKNSDLSIGIGLRFVLKYKKITIS